ncbi:hypothetical protein NMG60_11033669 [Bertholletia excelsa]
MATETKSKPSINSNIDKNSKRKKQRYLAHNKPGKKGSYPVRPGVQGFFITCDGGRERQASREAINVIDSFFEELVHEKASGKKPEELPEKPLNKKIKFTYSDSSASDSDSDDDDDVNNKCDDSEKKDQNESEDIVGIHCEDDNVESSMKGDSGPQDQEQCKGDNLEGVDLHENCNIEGKEPPAKKQCLERDASECGNAQANKTEEKSIDKLIEAELEELGDRSKRRFNSLDSGCNGVIFVQMRKRDGDPSPKDIVQHMVTSVASTRKHMSRFLLRVLPVEVTCYASEDEITKAIKPLILQYFPVETQIALKFAVLYEARANTGIDRMKIINAVAKSVPAPHKVDLNNPDKNIVVQIVKTVCLMGVVEKYKELAKYNLRQLASSKE